MHACNMLPSNPIERRGPASVALLELGTGHYRAAAEYVRDLPYGRNRHANDPLIVLREQKGTCSTKHALLRMLASEQNLPIRLMLGIYEMDERNTPGIGTVLKEYGVSCVPEAHCYLVYRGLRIDATRNVHDSSEPIGVFLIEQEITPDQVTEYKRRWHQQFLQQWLRERPRLGLDLNQLWQIREACIASLSGA